MPAYGSQATSGGQLTIIAPGDPASVNLFSAEIPVAGAASIAVAIAPKTASGGQQTVSLEFSCPGGIGAGVFQIQDADVDAAANYCSINFGGATPGTIATANMNASGVSRVELITAARFLRVLCTTAPGAAITVRARVN